MTQMLIAPRYNDNSIKDIQNGKQVSVGIARTKPGITLAAGESFTKEQVKYFGIGSVHGNSEAS